MWDLKERERKKEIFIYRLTLNLKKNVNAMICKISHIRSIAFKIFNFETTVTTSKISTHAVSAVVCL